MKCYVAVDCYECVGEEECKNAKPTRCRIPVSDKLACFKVDGSKPSKGCQKADPKAQGKDKCEKVKVGSSSKDKCSCHRALCNHHPDSKYKVNKFSSSCIMTIALGFLEIF